MSNLMNHNKWGHFTAVLLIEKKMRQKSILNTHILFSFFFIVCLDTLHNGVMGFGDGTPPKAV